MLATPPPERRNRKKERELESETLVNHSLRSSQVERWQGSDRYLWVSEEREEEEQAILKVERKNGVCDLSEEVPLMRRVQSKE